MDMGTQFDLVHCLNLLDGKRKAKLLLVYRYCLLSRPKRLSRQLQVQEGDKMAEGPVGARVARWCEAPCPYTSVRLSGGCHRN